MIVFDVSPPVIAVYNPVLNGSAEKTDGEFTTNEDVSRPTVIVEVDPKPVKIFIGEVVFVPVAIFKVPLAEFPLAKFTAALLLAKVDILVIEVGLDTLKFIVSP
jgi:hypothetical protein